MKQIRRFKLDCRGLTLIELIIGIAILAIVAVIVSRYVFSGSKFMENGRNEANLQMELQYVGDYISGELMECEKVVCDPSNQCFLLCKSKNNAILIYTESTSGIYRKIYHNDISSYYDESESLTNLGKPTYNLSEYVTTFSINKVSDRSYTVEVTVKKDGKTKSCKKQVKLRNGK